MSKLPLRVIIGAICLAFSTAYLARNGYPPLDPTLELKLSLPRGETGRCSAIVTTGKSHAGTVLYVRYTGPETVVFGYDSWGVGGPVSSEVRIKPGKSEEMTLSLPALDAPGRKDRKTRGQLRLVYAGSTVLQGEVHFHGREADEVYFGENPIGGTVTNEALPGEITLRDGTRLRGRPAEMFPTLDRATHALKNDPWRGAVALGASILVIWLAGFAADARDLLRRAGRQARTLWSKRRDPAVPARKERPHIVFVLTSLVCLALFATVISGNTLNPRDLFQKESFGRFYDDQAASLLQGRLAVPPEALDGEAFVFKGKVYGYFGPTPAILRIPFNLAGAGFGRLSRSYMVAYLAACLIAAYALLIHAARLMGGPGAWPARRHVVLLVLATGAGSSLFFLGSRAYIYHEAILCGAAFALWSVWATLRWLHQGGRNKAWIAALLCGVLSVHARPPTGLFALATLGCAAAWLLLRAARGPEGIRTPGIGGFTVVGILSILGVLSFNALSYLKFRSFDGAPLRYHVQYHPGRLANIDGRNFHFANIPYGLAGYLWCPNAEIRRSFPYFLIHGNNPEHFPGSRIDLAENTLAPTWSMPALSLLAALGFAVMALGWPGATAPLLVLAGGLAPMAAALLAAVAQSHRYTADFVPFLVAAAAFGLAGTDALGKAARRTWLALAAILTPVAIAITLAVTLHYQGEGVWGVAPDIQARYLAMRRWSDQLLGFKP